MSDQVIVGKHWPPPAWYLFEGEEDVGAIAFVRLNVAAVAQKFNVNPSIDIMLAMDTAPSTDFSLVSDTRFSMGANGVVTYIGGTIQKVLVRMTISVFTNGLVGFPFAVVSYNGDLIGSAAVETNVPLQQAGVAAGMATPAGNAIIHMTATRFLTLNTNDTVQPLVGILRSAGASDAILQSYQMVISAADDLS